MQDEAFPVEAALEQEIVAMPSVELLRIEKMERPRLKAADLWAFKVGVAQAHFYVVI
jgi:hypothetical protein